MIFRLLILIFGCALVTNLYKKAMSFEKGHAAMDPEKKSFYDTVEEISVQISKLYKDMTNKSQHHSDRFENQKIVAWLLNRSKESQSSERQQFFENLNKELRIKHRDENKFYNMGQGNKENKGSVGETETDEGNTVNHEEIKFTETEDAEAQTLNFNK